jgi:predicted nucleic acid-binding protein
MDTAPNFTLADITRSIAERAANLRSRYALRLPDALQVATAIERGASYFLTNDQRLRSAVSFASSCWTTTRRRAAGSSTR